MYLNPTTAKETRVPTTPTPAIVSKTKDPSELLGPHDVGHIVLFVDASTPAPATTSEVRDPAILNRDTNDTIDRTSAVVLWCLASLMAVGGVMSSLASVGSVAWFLVSTEGAGGAVLS